MDELALRTLLNNLEASRSSLHVLLHIFNWFVVFGLGFDLFVIIKEFRDDWKEFIYGEIHPYENHLPKRPSLSLLILALLGTALIVIGVAGELSVDVQTGKIETQIREANDNLLGLIIQEAGDAKTSAEGAANAASRAQASTEKIDADLAQTEWIISARRVQDVDGLTTDLKNGFKRPGVVLRSYIGDEEGFWLCTQLVDIAKKQGWTPRMSVQRSRLGMFRSPIH